MTELDTLLTQFSELTEKLESEFARKKREIQKQKDTLEESEMFSRYDPEHVDAFFKKPYVTLPRREEEWYLIVPKLFALNVGYLTKSTDSYNVFIVNKFADYLGAVPEEFRQVFKFKPKLPLQMFDGMLLTGPEHQDTAWERYSKFLVRREGQDKIRVKSGKQFELLSSLIADGILPFIPKPVEKSHMVEPVWITKIDEIERRRGMEFFKDAFKRFLGTGAVGIYWAMGVGKTIIGLEVLSRIKVDDRPNLVISGTSLALREQWIRQLKLIKPAAPVEVQAFQSWHKVKDRKWGVVIFDECHHLPADTFSKLATVDTEYRMGLSATPYREDKKTEYIFALTGFPVGLNWRVLIDLDLIKEPDITLFLCSTHAQKKQKLAELLNDTQKTLIYSFSIDIGKELSKAFDIPFVHGSTPVKTRMQIIKNSQTTIISSAGKEGLSVQDIERTISHNGLFGSRQEETQFFGRLLHGESVGHHIILMTDEEYDKYGKRLYGIQEKGFRIRVTRVGGGSSTSRTPKRSTPKRTTKTRPAPIPRSNPRKAVINHEYDTSEFPLLDERDKFTKDMILYILSSSFAKESRGLTIGDIKTVLDHSHVNYGKYSQLKDKVRGMYQRKELSGRREGTKRRYYLQEVET